MNYQHTGSHADNQASAVYDAIHKAIPEAEECISWGTPAFWKDCNIIRVAACRKYIGLYPGVEAIDAFADRLGEYKQKRRNSVSASERPAIQSD